MQNQVRLLSHRAWTASIVAAVVLFVVVTCSAQPVEHDVPCLEGTVAQVVYGDFSSGCAITPGTDTDQFTFCGTTGDVVLVTAAGATNDLDLRVEVFGPSGPVGSPLTCNSTSVTRCAVRLQLTLPATDCYTVTVSEVGADDTGPYSFQLERLFPPSDVAQAVAFGQSVATAIDPISDLDAYSFQADAGSFIRVLVGGETNDLDLNLSLRDPQGTVLGTSACQVGSVSTCTTSVEPSALTATGTYQFFVREDQSDQTGNYSVTLVCLGGPCVTATTTTGTSSTSTSSLATTSTATTSTTTTSVTTTSTPTTSITATTTIPITTTTSTAAPTTTTVITSTTVATTMAPTTSTTLPPDSCRSPTCDGPGCPPSPIPDGTPCDNGDACLGDTCQANTCSNDPLCNGTVAEQRQAGNKPVRSIAVRCSIDGATGFCEAQGFVPRSLANELLARQRRAGAAMDPLVARDDADVAVTKKARASFDRFGVARFSLKLNRLGKKLLKKAMQLGVPLDVTVKFKVNSDGDLRELRRVVRLARRGG